MREPLVAVAMAVLGGLATTLAWLKECRGTIGSLATLVDNSFYVLSLTWAACHSSFAFGLFFAACLAAMLLAFQGGFYGLSLPMALAIVVPPGVVILCAPPSLMVILALAGSGLLCLLRMALTGVWLRRARATRASVPLLTSERGVCYQLEEEVGSGGMGAVYRARTRTGARVAVKLLHRHFLDSSRARERFLKEALIVNSLDHTGVVPVIDYGLGDEGPPFLVMDFLRGQTLWKSLQQKGGRLPWREAVSIIVRVLEVLESAHEQGIIHCDLKPSNVFLCEDGTVKLLDFGIARNQGHLLDLTVSVHVAGTPVCMAPEQVLDPVNVGPRTDVWGAATTLFRAISGAWPREFPDSCGSLSEAMQLSVRPIESLISPIPRELSLALDVALRLEPAERWASALALRAQLLECLSAPEPGKRPRHHRREPQVQLSLP